MMFFLNIWILFQINLKRHWEGGGIGVEKNYKKGIFYEYPFYITGYKPDSVPYYRATIIYLSCLPLARPIKGTGPSES